MNWIHSGELSGIWPNNLDISLVGTNTLILVGNNCVGLGPLMAMLRPIALKLNHVKDAASDCVAHPTCWSLLLVCFGHISYLHHVYGFGSSWPQTQIYYEITSVFVAKNIDPIDPDG